MCSGRSDISLTPKRTRIFRYDTGVIALTKGTNTLNRQRVRKPLGVFSVAAAQVALGFVAAGQPALALLGGGSLLGAVAVLIVPTWVASVILAGSFAYWRIGPVSIADAGIVVAFAAVFPVVPWRQLRTKGLSAYLALYLLVIGLTIAAHPSGRALFEFAHRAALVGGSFMVGYALFTTDRVYHALRAYVVVATAFAFGAIIDFLGNPVAQGLHQPAYPFGMQKNPAALLIAGAVLVLLIAPSHVRLPRPVRAGTLILLVTGVVVCQSRGTAIALVVVLVAHGWRERRVAMSPVKILVALALVTMVLVSFKATETKPDRNSQFSPINTRLSAQRATIDLWEGNPVVGAGLRFWLDPATNWNNTEPHNWVVATLGESGVVGLVATLCLFGATLRALRGVSNELGSLALFAVGLKLTGSLFDIFWVAGTMMVPWVLVGIAVASVASSREAKPPSRIHAAA
jgi:O-antigen ligase